jgi:hypothetical protein
MYGFCLKKGMGYGFKSPAYQLGGSKNVWVTREYGLSGLWVMRDSTVVVMAHKDVDMYIGADGTEV